MAANHSLQPATDGDYRTAGDPSGRLARRLPTLVFYARVGRIVLAAARRARRGAFTDAEWIRASLAVRAAFERVGVRVAITGTRAFITLAEPCVFIGNHMSTAETFLLGSVILPFRPFTFVVKRSLVEYPVFKHIMRSRDPVVVGRLNPREDLRAVLEGGRQRLQAGRSLVIFPQRTRTATFDREAFNTIGVKLARRAGVPVVPLALKTDAWANGRWIKDLGPIRPAEPLHIAFGPALRIDAGERAVHEAVIAFIEGRLREWGVPVQEPRGTSSS